MQINYSFVIMAFLCHVQKEQHRGDIFSTFVDFGTKVAKVGLRINKTL